MCHKKVYDSCAIFTRGSERFSHISIQNMDLVDFGVHMKKSFESINHFKKVKRSSPQVF